MKAASHKTKEFEEIFPLVKNKTYLVVVSKENFDANFARGTRAFDHVKLISDRSLNVYDVMNKDTLVLLESSLPYLHKRLVTGLTAEDMPVKHALVEAQKRKEKREKAAAKAQAKKNAAGGSSVKVNAEAE